MVDVTDVPERRVGDGRAVLFGEQRWSVITAVEEVAARMRSLAVRGHVHDRQARDLRLYRRAGRAVRYDDSGGRSAFRVDGGPPTITRAGVMPSATARVRYVSVFWWCWTAWDGRDARRSRGTAIRAAIRRAIVVEFAGGLKLPTMESLGTGHARAMPGVKSVQAPLGARGRLTIRRQDSTTGHWEMMGIVLDQAFPT